MSLPMSTRTRLGRAVLALAALVLFAAPAAAQFDSAQMSGFVQDDAAPDGPWRVRPDP